MPIYSMIQSIIEGSLDCNLTVFYNEKTKNDLLYVNELNEKYLDEILLANELFRYFLRLLNIVPFLLL